MTTTKRVVDAETGGGRLMEVAAKVLQVSKPFPSTFNLLNPAAGFKNAKQQHPHPHVSPSRALDGGSEGGRSSDQELPPADADFDGRLSKVRLKYRSGTGKKAEQRRARKPGVQKFGSGLVLPPVDLKEAVAAGGVRVEVGFTAYSERLNGQLAALGLVALLLVELGSGRSVINYHTPAIVLVQIYFIAAAGALFVKYQKERVSVWPEKGQTLAGPPSSSASSAVARD